MIHDIKRRKAICKTSALHDGLLPTIKYPETDFNEEISYDDTWHKGDVMWRVFAEIRDANIHHYQNDVHQD